MLDTSRLLIRASKNIQVLPSEIVNEEGLPLVQVMNDGMEAAAVSGYEGARHFLGFSYGETMWPHIKAAVEDFIITGTRVQHTLTLGRTPLSGQISVRNAKDQTEFTVADSAEAVAKGKYYLSGAIMTFSAEDAGTTVRIQYRYTPSTQEVKFMDRTPYTFNTASEELGQIGVILDGDIFTDKFDAAINWDALDTDDVLLAGENGVVTAGTPDEKNLAIPGVVIATPNVNSPFLGIRFGIH